MIYFIIVAVVLIILISIRKRTARKAANTLTSYDCVRSTQLYSIYSKYSAGGRSFYVLSNSAPLLITNSVYNSSKYDSCLEFITRIEKS